MPSTAGRSRWRLLLAFDQPGTVHMATDEALLDGFAPGRDRPILRLSSWAPPCLSLGYGQPIADVDLDACRRAGVDVVRRPTGGRAVLHDRELTYAIVAGVDDPAVGGTIGQTYAAIAAGLLAGLRALGVPAAVAPGVPADDQAARRSGACFAAAARHEIVWQGRKLAGSAQVRRRGVFLQHGSLLLARGQTALTDLLRPADADALADHLAAGVATVADIAGPAPDPAAAAQAFAPAFAAALGIALQPGDLTPDEAARAWRSQAERYATPAWTQRR